MVEREAVARDPARNPNPNRRHLLVSNPDAGQARDARSRNAEIRRGTNQHLFEIAHVAMHIAPIGLQVDDRIADDLPGAVIGDIAPSASMLPTSCAKPSSRHGIQVNAHLS